MFKVTINCMYRIFVKDRSFCETFVPSAEPNITVGHRTKSGHTLVKPTIIEMGRS